ncbi:MULTISPECIES: cupin domain-containing protein [unclassified Fusibacter]|uniref:cupin domain-containing protein n=1 Tax=unclassified Fusibacter TaxID=2624464 RepID=UPI0013E8F68F|nr:MULTISPECIES: cupin domain-containing protein [unclassified Fusibacter]MCK8060647.1 cupin domain-containing protein [Fusibacter sp. A2]NPE22899.1 cupin domain-containing protein [Fusibacter sp. A1]
MPLIINEKNSHYKKNDSPIGEFEWFSSIKLAHMPQSEHLNFKLMKLQPGKFSYPYHFHHNAEEVFVILSGEATLRTHKGMEIVSQGDVIFFEKGPKGAHQLFNHSEGECQYLDLQTNLGFDVCEYPDSEKVNLLPDREIVHKGKSANYYDGEEAVLEKWIELNQ